MTCLYFYAAGYLMYTYLESHDNFYGRTCRIHSKPLGCRRTSHPITTPSTTDFQHYPAQICFLNNFSL